MLVPKVQFNKEFVSTLRKSLSKQEVARVLRFLSFARSAKAPTLEKTLLDLNAARKALKVPYTFLAVPLCVADKNYWMGYATGGNLRSDELLYKLVKLNTLIFDNKSVNHGGNTLKHKSQAVFINMPLIEGFDSLSARLIAEMNALTPAIPKIDLKGVTAISPCAKSRKAEKSAVMDVGFYDAEPITEEEAEENAAWIKENFKSAEVFRKILTAKDKRKINTSILGKSNAEIEALLKSYKLQASTLSGNAKANIEDEIKQIETVVTHYRKRTA